MTYDSRIILGGQGVDVMGAMGQGNALAAQTNELRKNNALAELYRAQGPGIVSGDQGAMNALAQLDPAQAMGYQQNQLGMEQTRQNMAFSAEEMQMKRDQIKAEAKAWAAQQDAATVEAEQAKLTAVLRGASQLHATGDQAGYAAWLQQNGIDPAEYPFEQFPAYAGMFEGVLEAWNEAKPDAISPNERFKVAGSTLFDLGAEGGPAPVGQGVIPEEVVMGADGKPITIKGPPGTTAKFTEGQSKDNVYATRAEGALARLDPVADALTSVTGRALEYDPTGLARGAFQGDAFQTAKQAGDEFLQAILRKDTGAAITAQEQELYGKTYLPQPGDNPALLAQKKKARLRALNAMKSGMNMEQLAAQERALMASGDTPIPQGGTAATDMSDEEFLKTLGLE